MEIEWFNDPTCERTWGVTKVLGTSEWAVVCRHIEVSLFGWSDPRAVYGADPAKEAVRIVTVAPNKEVAIGYIKLLKEG